MSPILILIKKNATVPPAAPRRKKRSHEFPVGFYNDLSFFLQLTKPQLKITQQGVSAYIIVISSLKKHFFLKKKP